MLAGIGLGFRRDLADALIGWRGSLPAFIELAPENWMQIGGYWRRKLLQAAERYPVTAHGLSLSLGSPEPLDWEFLKGVKQFFEEVPVQIYTEHLSYAKCDNAHLYDLLPIPFREDAVHHVADRIKQVQDFLGRKIAIENVSYYTPVAPELDEHTFISAVVKEADCLLLLDVNNVYVNAFNHQYDAKDFISKLPLDKVAYIHMAGHEQVSDDLIIDTHGAEVIDPVYELFEWTAQRINPVPVLLERDFNIPDLEELLPELGRLNAIATRHWDLRNAA
ncbi:MAG: DUF692 domain-containing protein [Bdellovibrionales bacterium]|nr:DUF692 domain-containing protein [Bdellovibrionales bacterium]